MPDLNSNNPVNRSKMKESSSAVLKAMIVMLVVLVGVSAALGFIVYSEYKSDEPTKTTDKVASEAEKPDEQAAMLAAVDTDKIYENIFINGVNVGSMTKAQANLTLKEKLVLPLEEKTITLTYEEKVYKLPYKAFYVGYELEQALNEAFSYARDGSVLERFNKVSALKSKPYEITAVYFYDENAVKNTVMSLEEEISVPAVNASIQRIDGEFVTTAEAEGIKLDVDKTALLISDAIKLQEEGPIEIAVMEDVPRFREKDLVNAQSLIGTFTTKTTAGNTPRNTNLKNALSKINNAVIYPEEIFSTNEYFGEMSYDNGYRVATIISGGKFEDGMGGGVCQISSTLYMALLYAELEIVERQNHSLKVTYADYGFDATLSEPYIDLKFKNNTNYPVVIEGFMEGGTVTVNVYGFESRSPERTLKFSNKLISTTPAPQGKVIEDPNLPLGQQVESSSGRNGYKYELYKTVYENGTQIEQVRVNTSTYRATASEIRVGTNPDLPIEGENGESVDLGNGSGQEPTQNIQEQEQPQNEQPTENNFDANVWPDGIPNGNTDTPSDLSDLPQADDLDLSILNALRDAEINP